MMNDNDDNEAGAETIDSDTYRQLTRHLIPSQPRLIVVPSRFPAAVLDPEVETHEDGDGEDGDAREEADGEEDSDDHRAMKHVLRRAREANHTSRGAETD